MVVRVAIVRESVQGCAEHDLYFFYHNKFRNAGSSSKTASTPHPVYFGSTC